MRVQRIIIAMTLLVMVGCTTEKRCASKFPPRTETETIYKDSIREIIRYRDTTVFVQLPAKTVEKAVYISVPSDYASDTVTAMGEYSHAAAWVANRMLQLRLDEGGAMKIKLEKAVKESEYWQHKWNYERKKEVVVEKYLPKFWLIAGIIGIIAVLLLLYRLLKGY